MILSNSSNINLSFVISRFSVSKSIDHLYKVSCLNLTISFKGDSIKLSKKSVHLTVAKLY